MGLTRGRAGWMVGFRGIEAAWRKWAGRLQELKMRPPPKRERSPAKRGGGVFLGEIPPMSLMGLVLVGGYLTCFVRFCALFAAFWLVPRPLGFVASQVSKSRPAAPRFMGYDYKSIRSQY